MQGFPKGQPLQNSTYQSETVTILKSFFPKIDYLVDNIMLCPRVKLPNSNT